MGGFGYGSHGSVHVDVVFAVDDYEITVSTSVGQTQRANDDEEIRQAILRSVESVFDRGVTLPLTLHFALSIEEVLVEVLVDDAPVMFRGILSSELDDWEVSAGVGDGIVIGIGGRRGVPFPRALRIRADLTLDDPIASS